VERQTQGAIAAIPLAAKSNEKARESQTTRPLYPDLAMLLT